MKKSIEYFLEWQILDEFSKKTKVQNCKYTVQKNGYNDAYVLLTFVAKSLPQTNNC